MYLRTGVRTKVVPIPSYVIEYRVAYFDIVRALKEWHCRKEQLNAVGVRIWHLTDIDESDLTFLL